MGTLPNSKKVIKIRLNDSRVKNKYDSVIAIIIDNESKERVDYQEFRFYDTWGRLNTNNPNFKDGIVPYIWNDGKNIDWYVVKPNIQQVNTLVDKINCYISYFS